MVDMFIDEKPPMKMFPLKYVNFEGLTLPVPNNWKEVLSSLYGSDYMEVPREGSKQRVQWDYPEPLMSCDEFRGVLARRKQRERLRMNRKKRNAAKQKK